MRKVRQILESIPFEERIPVKLFRALAETDRVALVDVASENELTYRALSLRADAISLGLLSAGVREGDRVAWSAPTGPEAIAIWMAIAQIGAIDVGIGDVLKGALLDHVMNDCRPHALIIDPTMTAGLASLDADRRAAFGGIIFIRDPDRVLSANEVILDPQTLTKYNGSGPVLDLPALDCRSPATVIYTSGTTGPSKGVMLCHHHQFFTGANLVEHFRIDENSTLYHYSPFNHVTGRQLVVAAMLTNSLMVMRERFSIDGFWRDINGHKITHSITLGSAVPLLLNNRDPAARNEGTLRFVWASPALSQLYADFAERFGLKVVSPYGSTEVGIVVEPGVIPDDPGPFGNSGKRPEYFDLEVLDDNDQICPPGIVGEIAVRPKLPWTTFLGYLGRDGSTVDRSSSSAGRSTLRFTMAAARGLVLASSSQLFQYKTPFPRRFRVSWV